MAPAHRVCAMLLALCAWGVCGCARSDTGPRAAAQNRVLRIGHFPNITHAHGLVAHAQSRARKAGKGEGWFEKRLGTDVEWYVYNAGPSAMEALIAGSIDATYVGPSPAINAHMRTRGDEIRVLAGATRGGSALVGREGGPTTAEGFRKKRIATPQLGNTQDVSCRAWLRAGGVHVHQTGGDALVVPTQNPDQLALFKKGDVDAVWTVEPWVSRLEREAGGKIVLLENDAVTTVLVASASFVAKHPERVRALVEAHAELCQWLVANAEQARGLVREEFKAETSRNIDKALLEHCWPRLRFSPELDPRELANLIKGARSVGFLQESKLGVERLVEVAR